MYGQADKKNHNGVKLARMESHDGRQGRGGHRRAAQRRTAIFLASMLFLIIACMGAIYYVIHLDAQESLAGVEPKNPEENPPEEKPPESSQEQAGGNTGSSAEVPVETESPVDEKTPLVVIDAGHGGIDGGSGRSGVLEKEVNLEIAKRLEEELKELGFEILMIREDNETTVPKEDRVKMANEAKGDLYISIHQNTYKDNDNDVSGTETYYCEESEGSERLAKLVQAGVVKATGARDRGLKETDGLYVVREADMPCCLVEVCFLTNKKEREAVVTAEYQDKLAKGIAEAIYSFFYDDKK